VTNFEHLDAFGTLWVTIASAGPSLRLIEGANLNASETSVGFGTTVLRLEFGAGMTVRNYRDKEIVFSQVRRG